MTNYNSYRTGMVCTAVTGSMTKAMKAQRALSAHALRSNVIKVSRSSAKHGCTYGVEFDCALLGNVRVILDKADIEVTEYIR